MRKSVILALFTNEVDYPNGDDIAEDYGFFVTIDHILKFNPDFRWDVEALKRAEAIAKSKTDSL